MTSAYDEFAWIYDRYWAQPFQDWQAPAIERLLLPHVPAGARILDLCCGVGKLAASLVERGFDLVGVDGSAEMLRFAARNAPAARFVHAPATLFCIEEPVDAAVCTFDSVNHMLSIGEATDAFRNVRRALRDGGSFLCDINTADAYGEQWDRTWSTVEADHAFFVRGGYDAETRTGSTEITIFRLHEHWERSDVQVSQRCYSVEEIAGALREAGFATVESFRACEGLGLKGHFGIGRVYLLACGS